MKTWFHNNFVKLAAFLALVISVSSCKTTAPSTKSQPNYPVRIALVSDSHVTRGQKDDQPKYRERFERAIREVNAAGVDLVLMSGDLTENGYKEELADYRKIICQFNAPVWYVPGNHDIGNKRVPGNKEAVTFRKLADYEMRMGNSWWVREFSGVRVIGINSCILGSGMDREKRMWRDLEKELARPSKKTTIAMLHHPLFQKSAGEPGGVYWNVEPYPRMRLLGLLKQGGTSVVLSGHLHKALTNSWENIQLLTVPSVCHGKAKDKPQWAWMLLTVSGKGKVEHELRVLKEPEP